MKKYLKLLLSLLMVFSLTYSVNAEEEQIKDVVSIYNSSNTDKEDNLVKDEAIFALDSNLTYDYINDGISFILANNLTIKGTSEYAFVLGNHIDGKEANILKDAFMLGKDINYGGLIGRDAYVSGQKVTLSGTVGRNLYAAVEDLTIDATVNGDLHLTVKNLTIDDNSAITGKITINEDAVIEGKTDGLEIVTYSSNVIEEDDETFGDNIFNFISSTINMILVGLVMVYLFGTKVFDKNYKEYKPKKYVTTTLMGFVTIIVVPVASILLMISTFGFGLGLLALIFYGVCFYLTQIIALYFIGKYASKICKLNENKYLTIAVGALAYKVLSIVPFIGGFVVVFAVAYGFGYLCNLVFKKN